MTWAKGNLKVCVKLHLDDVVFIVLGITCDRHLMQILKLNYKKAVADVERLLVH